MIRDIHEALKFATNEVADLTKNAETWKEAHAEAVKEAIRQKEAADKLRTELERLKKEDSSMSNGWSVQVQKYVIESPFSEAVRNELGRARNDLKFPPMASLHEGFAVILEEVHEFWNEVKKKPDERSKEKLYEELVQIAAMCQRTAEDLKLGGEG